MLSAFVAYVSAEETQALVVPEAVIRFLDERHFEKMAQVVRDEGMSEDTLDLFANDPAIPTPSKAVERRIRFCGTRAAECWKNARNDPCKELACLNGFVKCVYTLAPGYIKKLPLTLKACAGVLHLCMTKSQTCEGGLCCYVRIKRCVAYAIRQES